MTHIEFIETDISGTSLVGYLYPDEYIRNYSKVFNKIPSFYNFDSQLNICKLSFEETVARLYNLSNQEIFSKQDEDCSKLSFQIVGKYKDQVFTLYDYKEDMAIHIGGNSDLDINGLRKELDRLIMNTEPKAYTAKCNYDQCQTYKYP